jgi:large subunit ribosomal protein L33
MCYLTQNSFYDKVICVKSRHENKINLTWTRKELKSCYLVYFSINSNDGETMRVKVTLACTECKQRNYNTMKNKKNDPDRLEANKYCKFCKTHTLHRETK